MQSRIDLLNKISVFTEQLQAIPLKDPRGYPIKDQLAQAHYTLAQLIEKEATTEADFLKSAEHYIAARELTRYWPACRRLHFCKNHEFLPELSRVRIVMSPFTVEQTSEHSYLRGMLYYAGLGTNIDLQKAFSEFKQAADQGHPSAQQSLGWMYRNGRGVTPDDQRAVYYYQLAADQGLALAQANLGFMYQGGRGVAQDGQRAVHYYQLAADQGHADAQYNLGWMYQNSRGVTQDDRRAVHYYQLAADQGVADAQYNLGFMYDASKSKKIKFLCALALQDDEKIQACLSDERFHAEVLKILIDHTAGAFDRLALSTLHRLSDFIITAAHQLVFEVHTEASIKRALELLKCIPDKVISMVPGADPDMQRDCLKQHEFYLQANILGADIVFEETRNATGSISKAFVKSQEWYQLIAEKLERLQEDPEWTVAYKVYKDREQESQREERLAVEAAEKVSYREFTLYKPSPDEKRLAGKKSDKSENHPTPNQSRARK